VPPTPTPPICPDGRNSIPNTFCGRGGGKCDEGQSCYIDPTDAFAVCCFDPTPPICPDGRNPIPNTFCGRGGEKCDEGQSCYIDPTDAFAVCCFDPTPQPTKSPTFIKEEQKQTIILLLDNENVVQLLHYLINHGLITEEMNMGDVITALSGDNELSRKLTNLIRNGRALVEADVDNGARKINVRDMISGKAVISGKAGLIDRIKSSLGIV
jgi:hypothetical protein